MFSALSSVEEFYFYYFCFTIVVPYMFYVTYRLSKGKLDTAV